MLGAAAYWTCTCIYAPPNTLKTEVSTENVRCDVSRTYALRRAESKTMTVSLSQSLTERGMLSCHSGIS